MGKHQDWTKVDWSKTSSQIALELGCSKSAVDAARGRYAPESRQGRHNKRTLSLRLDKVILDTLEFQARLIKVEPEALVTGIVHHFLSEHSMPPATISRKELKRHISSAYIDLNKKLEDKLLEIDSVMESERQKIVEQILVGHYSGKAEDAAALDAEEFDHERSHAQVE